MTECVVIVGGGAAAHSVCSTLRAEGFAGSVLVLTDESELPYERPPLSKDLLAGEVMATDLLFAEARWYAEHDIDVRHGAIAKRIEPHGRLVRLEGGEAVPYDALVIATGGRPRTLPGVAGERVHHLRTSADAARLGERLTPGSRLVIIGGGFIGCEVAATARGRAVDVIIMESTDVLLSRALGAEVGGFVQDIHVGHGVEVRCGTSVTGVDVRDDGVTVRTDHGDVVADQLLVAIGLVPNDDLCRDAGICVENGIVTDSQCRTSVADVWAVGDVASYEHAYYGAHLRVEHHDSAIKQGVVAARSILGIVDPHVDPHWFWSDQYSHNMQGVGLGSAFDSTVVRGTFDSGSFSVFYLLGDRIRSVFTFDRGKDVVATRRLLAADVHPAIEQLADESIDLRKLIPRPARSR